MSLPRDERVLSRAISTTGISTVAGSIHCDQQQLNLELNDHRQQTLEGVVSVVRNFAAANDDADVWFRLGSGNASHEAATNEVIERGP